MTSEHVFLNMDEAIERMGDKEIYLEISRFFATRLPEALTELQVALDEANIADATRFAHSMKSNCGTMGAELLRDECFTLEKLCRAGELEPARTLFAQLVPQLWALQKALLAL